MLRLLFAALISLATLTAQAAEKIIITGASGGFATETIEALLARGVKPADLILVTRTPDKTPALQELAAKGAAVRKGDFNDPDSLPAAFAGGNRILVISTSGGGDRVVQHTNAFTAAKKAGVRQALYTSYIAADDPTPLSRDHKLTEEALKNSGLQYTILRNEIYADRMVADGARAVAAGEVVSSSPDRHGAPFIRKDGAAAAAAILTTAGHENKTYDITGPELVSDRDFAAILTELTGKPVKVTLRAGSNPAFGAPKEGHVSTAIEQLTGKKPTSVRELLTANKDKLLASAPPR
jgi:NAD(P)H dehydrogenase (quinone)